MKKMFLGVRNGENEPFVPLLEAQQPQRTDANMLTMLYTVKTDGVDR